MTEKELYRFLWKYHQHFPQLRRISDAGTLHEACQKLAHEGEDYKDHGINRQVLEIKLKLDGHKGNN